MLEGIASSLLSYFLAKYIDKINANDLKVSLFSGKVSLDNLSIKHTALMEHNLPFKVVNGIIKSITLSLPYTKLKTAPCIANIDEIFILGKLCGNVLLQSDVNTITTNEEYGSLDAALQGQDVSKGDVMQGIAGTIIDNLQVNVTNIHIRLEYAVGGNVVAIGVMIPLIKVCTIDEAGKEIAVNNSTTCLRKKLLLENLSVYVDTNCHEKFDNETNNNAFRSFMLDSMKSPNHQFILHNFSFSVVYEHPKSGNAIQFGNILSITTSSINLALDSLQYRCFNELEIERSRFNRRRFYSICGRPEKMPENDNDSVSVSLWWHFLGKCSYKKSNPITFSVKNALVFLKNRKKYLNDLSNILKKPNPKKDEPYLNKLQAKYGGDVYLLFRAYAKMVTENQIRMNSKNSKSSPIDLSSSEWSEIISQKDTLTNNSETLKVNFSIKEINLGLAYNPQMPLALLQFSDMSGEIQKNKDDIIVGAKIGDMVLVNKRSKEMVSIVKLNKSELTEGQCAILKINGNLGKNLFMINFNAASPEFYADFNMLADVKGFFSTAADLSFEESAPVAKRRDMTNPEIQNAIENHKTILLNVHFEAPILKIPYKMPIDITLGNIDIKTVNHDRKRVLENTQTWFDEFSLDISGFAVKMNEVNLCDPVNINVLFMQSFIRRETLAMTQLSTKISQINFNISHDQYVALLQFPEMFAVLNEPPKHQLAIETSSKINQNENKVVVVPPKNGPVVKQIESSTSSLSLRIDVKFEQLKLTLNNKSNNKNENEQKVNTISEFLISGITASFGAVQGEIEAKFLMQFLCITGISHENNQQMQICNFGSNDELWNAALSVGTMLRGINFEISLQSASPEITVDVNWLKDILDFFKMPIDQAQQQKLALETRQENVSPQKSQRRESTVSMSTFLFDKEKKDVNDYQLMRALMTHPCMDVEININAPKIIIPYQSTPISINFGNLHIFSENEPNRDPSNIETFYDKFSIEFKDLEVKLSEQFILNPFSTKIDIAKSFITRKDVQSIRVNVDIEQLKVQLKQSQFRTFLGVADSFLILSDSSSPEKLDEPKPVQALPAPKIKERKMSISSYSDNDLQPTLDAVKDEIDIFSILADLKFEDLQISLINEDDSTHSCFMMKNLGAHFNTLKNDIDASFKIDTLRAVSGEKVLLGLGEEGVKSLDITFNSTNNNQVIVFDAFISKPTLNVDFRWIFQLQKFFEMPAKQQKLPSKKARVIEEITAEAKEYKNKKVLLSKTETKKEKKPLPHIEGKFIITHPSITIVLLGKNHENENEIKNTNENEKKAIELLVGVEEINATMNKDQTGFFCIKDIQLAIDNRYLMNPFTIKIDLAIKPEAIKASLELPELLLNLQTSDYQLFLEISEYIPAVLLAEFTDTAVAIAPERIEEIISDADEMIEVAHETEEELIKAAELHSHFDLDFKIGKAGLVLSEKEKVLFNFEINKIAVSIEEKGSLAVKLDSVVCQEHVSCECNNLICLETPTIVTINEHGRINVMISDETTFYVKMEAIQAILTIFSPREQLLDYQKPSKKTKSPNTINKKPTTKSESSGGGVFVSGKKIEVRVLDQTDILTVLVNGFSYEMTDKGQNIIVKSLLIFDPTESEMYPPNIIKNYSEEAVRITLAKNITTVNVNAFTVFANFNAIKRALDVVADHPLNFPTSEEDGEDEVVEPKVEEVNENKENWEVDEIGSGNKSKISINLNKTKIIVPISINKSNEMLELCIDAVVEIDDSIHVNLKSFTTSFFNYSSDGNNTTFPYICNMGFAMTQKENAICISTDLASINISPSDIASINVLVESVLKFIASLRLPEVPQQKKKQTRTTTSSLTLESESELTSKEEEQTISNKPNPKPLNLAIETNGLVVQLNSDRYHTVPLFKLVICKLNISFSDSRVSKFSLIFDGINYFDATRMEWKMLIEPFALDCFLSAISPEVPLTVEVTAVEAININLSYYALQMIFKHSKELTEMISAKELYSSKPPFFKIRNITTIPISVLGSQQQNGSPKSKNTNSSSVIIINPLEEKEFNTFTRNNTTTINILNRAFNFVLDYMYYPIFCDDFHVISQKLTESGTTITISSIVVFQNCTELSLNLFVQKKMKAYRNVLSIQPEETVPISNKENILDKYAICLDATKTSISHSTFTLKSIKKRAILLECYVNDKMKLKLVVSANLDPTTCVTTIKIEPNCVIKNLLPTDLYIKVQGSDIFAHIKDGKKLKTTTIDTTKGNFKGHFATGVFPVESSLSENNDNDNKTKIATDSIVEHHIPITQINKSLKLSKRVEVSTSNNSISPIELTYIVDASEIFDHSSIINVACEASLNPSKPQTTLCFYAPTIVFNRSGFKLSCIDNFNEEKRISKLVKFARRDKRLANENVSLEDLANEDGYLLWHNEDFFQKKDEKRKLPLRLMVSDGANDYTSEEIIECTTTHIDGPVMIPTAKPEIFLPLHYAVSSSEPYSHTTIVTITSQCEVKNHLSQSIFIQPIIEMSSESKKFGDIIEIKENSKFRVNAASNSLLFAFKLANNNSNNNNDDDNNIQDDYVVINFSEPIHTTFKLDDTFIEIENQLFGVEMLITFKRAIVPQPVMVVNDLEDVEFTFSQKGAIKIVQESKPQTTSIVAYETPFGDSDLVLHIKDKDIFVDLVHVNTSKQIENEEIYYEVVTNVNNTKSITISKKPIEHKKVKETKFTVDIPIISISIVDKLDHEFCLLTLQKTSFLFSTGDLTQIQFKLRAFQLDDLHPISMLKVVAAGYPEVNEGQKIEDRNLIDFSVSMFPKAPMFTSCKEISFTIEPIILFIDLSFISDTINLMQDMFSQPKLSLESIRRKPEEGKETKEIEEEEESYLLRKPTNIVPSQLSSIPLSAESLTINEICLTLFVRSKSTRPTIYPELSSFLKAVPEITNGKIVLPSFHFDDCTMNAAYIKKEIVTPLIKSGIQQGLKMFFNTDIFMRSTGTKSASFAKRGERLMNGELQVLVQVPGSMILQGGESVVNVASKLVHFATFEKNSAGVNRVNTTAKDTMKGGLKALGDGFVEGFTGVVKDPMQMGQERGVGGAVLGVFKGLTGIVTKPIAGILDAGVASFAAARKAMTGEDADVIPPIRIAHALAMLILPNYTDEMFVVKDIAQLSFQTAAFSDGNLYKEYVEMYAIDTKSKKWFGVTQNYVFEANNEGNLKDKWRINEVFEVKNDGNAVHLVVKELTKKKQINIESENQKDLFEFAQLINSRKVALAIGE